MPSPHPDDRLAERRYVTVVLRVLLDGHGQLVHVEVIVPGVAATRRVGHWRGLAEAVRVSVTETQPGSSA